jgi:hypothetical protein
MPPPLPIDPMFPPAFGGGAVIPAPPAALTAPAAPDRPAALTPPVPIVPAMPAPPPVADAGWLPELALQPQPTAPAIASELTVNRRVMRAVIAQAKRRVGTSLDQVRVHPSRHSRRYTRS